MNKLDFTNTSVVAALLLCISASAVAKQSPLPTISLPPELARVLADYETAWRDQDEKALAALFVEDGFVLTGGSPPVKGRAQIEQRYKGSGGPLSLRAIAYAVEESIAYIIGGYSQNPGEVDVGKFTLTLQKQADGRWMIMSDMDNGNQVLP